MRVIVASSIDSRTGPQFTNIEPGIDESYAILSHTWGADGDEVLYTDILEGQAHTRKTYEAKVAFTCRRAIADNYRYVWIDTCCIDKSSSAELSEAINSMFQWYRQSAVCYALLSDVPGDIDIHAPGSAFSRARWFTRGFTLQELLAPPNVVFYSNDWIELGNKVSLSKTLASITSIDVAVLIGDCPIEATSIANRMGWAANRVTKRPEDIAYCLMGIFSVNMPLLYGEGTKAFIRLQEEIMKSSTDHSLFAWIDENAPRHELKGVLAQSPSMFSKTSAISPFAAQEKQKPYSMTNMGLSIQLPMNELTDSKGTFVTCFHCPTPEVSNETFFGIYLKKLDTSNNDMRFARVNAATYCPITVYQYTDKKDVYLNIHPSPREVTAASASPFSRPVIRFGSQPLPMRWFYQLVSVTVYPGGQTYSTTDSEHHWSESRPWPLPAVYLRQGKKQISCAIMINTFKKEQFLILLGTADDSTTVAYHIVDMQNDLSSSEYSPNRIPNMRVLESFYRQPMPLGEKFLFRDTQIDLERVKQNGREHEVQVNVYRVTESKKSRAETFNSIQSDSSSSSFKLRSQLSRVKILKD